MYGVVCLITIGQSVFDSNLTGNTYELFLRNELPHLYYFCSCFVVIVILCIFIFVCTSVGLLPPGESPIAVSNNNNNNNNNNIPLMMKGQMYFQRDGTPPHYSRRVTEHLHESYWNRWSWCDPLRGHEDRHTLHILIPTPGATWRH
jgi:hypothetical protein